MIKKHFESSSVDKSSSKLDMCWIMIEIEVERNKFKNKGMKSVNYGTRCKLTREWPHDYATLFEYKISTIDVHWHTTCDTVSGPSPRAYNPRGMHDFTWYVDISRHWSSECTSRSMQVLVSKGAKHSPLFCEVRIGVRKQKVQRLPEVRCASIWDGHSLWLEGFTVTGLYTSICSQSAMSSSCSGASTFCLLVSTMQPFISISSTMKCACKQTLQKLRTLHEDYMQPTSRSYRGIGIYERWYRSITTTPLWWNTVEIVQILFVTHQQ